MYSKDKQMTTSNIVRDSADMDGASAKAQLRTRLLAQRRQRSAADKAAAEAAICVHLLAWLQTHPVRILGVYHPIRQEPDLSSLYNVLQQQGVDLALPIIRGPALPLDFLQWTPGAALHRDALGTNVPENAATVQPQALLIPCLGFNAARIRLGYGGGFYDRTLAQQPRPFSIGVAYRDAQAEFVGEKHDIALDLIISGP